MFYYWLATLGQRSPFTFYTSSSVIMAGVAKTFFDFALSDLAGSAHAFSQYAGKVGCDAAVMSSLACAHMLTCRCLGSRSFLSSTSPLSEDLPN